MAVGRTISAVQSCGNCQHRLLSTLASLAGLSLRPPVRASPLYQRAGSTQHCSFSTSRIRPLEALQKCEEGEPSHEPIAAEASGEVSEDPGTTSQNTNDSIPWYLQVRPPPVAQNPLADRQRIPDLPADPPPLLQPILEHLSVQVGLDNLILLDIRKLDPPPALGANLLMIIGTARSEKHLHVSADRFSRWLRTTYKLHPYADGLLGRNELKIKLRRKTRRAKLLGSVGSAESGINADDGIRTGWVCVNVGSIEEASNAEQEDLAPQVQEDFVGFREEVDGVKLVVQMLTEEKREELDLESLWGGFLARQQRKEAREAEKQLEEARALEVGQSPPDVRQSVTDAASLTANRLPTSRATLPSNRRTFHSSTKLRTTEHCVDKSLLEYERLDSQSVEPRISEPKPVEAEQYTEDLVPKESFHRSAQILELEAHMRYLETLPRDDAIQILGLGADDHDSTTFLTSFYQHFPLFPESDHWQYRFGLLCHAFLLGHPGYTKADVFNAVREMQSSAIDIPPSIFEDALRIIAGPDNTLQPKVNGPSDISVEDVMKIMDLLADMDLRQLDIFQESIISHLVTTLALTNPTENPEEPSQLRKDALWQLISLLDKRQIYLTRSSSHYTILNALVERADWDGFWRYWHGIARRMQRKPFIIYALMFRAVARKGHQAESVHALREWVPEMELEEPPVPLSGMVAEAVMECLRIAEPGIEAQVGSGRYEVCQWVRLWRRCERGREEADQLSKEDEEDGLVELYRRTG